MSKDCGYSNSRVDVQGSRMRDQAEELEKVRSERDSYKLELSLMRDKLRKIKKMRYASGRGPESFDRIKEAVKEAYDTFVL